LGTGVLNVQILGIGRFFGSENPPKPETTGGSLVLNFFMKKLEWEFMTKSKNCP